MVKAALHFDTRCIATRAAEKPPLRDPYEKRMCVRLTIAADAEVGDEK